MRRVMPHLGLFACFVILLFPVSGHAEKPTKVEIGKRAKAATAFVEVPGHGSGTAFCIHSSGLFVTNEHVVRGDGVEITLVLNSSLATERILKAKVVRADKAGDLALLRVDGVKDLPSLEFGTAEDVAELAEVVACGFPLGRALSTDKKELPACSVNAGSVTSLRLKGGELEFIQTDIALTYGNSGGPVLGDNGKVIGMVVSGIGGGKAGINLAIPVNRLERFLKAPDIAFTPPALTRDNLGRPTEFTARVTFFVPDAPEPSLRLALQSGDETPREFPMKKSGGAWAVTVPSAGQSARGVEVSCRFGMGMVTGAVKDSVVVVGGKPFRMSAVRRIDSQPNPGILLSDGKTFVEGVITGLALTEIDVGGQTFKLDLSKAASVTVQSSPEITQVTAVVIATVNGKEVARTEAKMAVREPEASSKVDPSSVIITPPSLTEDKVVKQLPDVFSEVMVGGGGRYLIFHLPKLKKLAVFDVNEAKVTKYIPLAEDDVTFAAGLDSLVIGLKKSGRLERWSLTSFEMEKSAPPPFKEDIKVVLMGHGSDGPLVVNGFFLNLATFRPLPLEIQGADGRAWPPTDRRIPSADGTVFGAWNTHLSPSSSTTFVCEGGAVKRYGDGDLRHVIPGPDGRTVFTGKGLVTRLLTRADEADAAYGYCLPAVRGDYFLSVSSIGGRVVGNRVIGGGPGGKGGGFTVYLRGLKQPVAKLDDADHGLAFDGWDREEFGPWRRVCFVPDAKVIIVLPASNDRLVLHKFDPEAALEKSGQNYLLVTSRSPREVKIGMLMSYPVKVKAKNAKVTFKLDSGPKGMAVSPTGVITWTPSSDETAGDRDVILTIRDGEGLEVFHTFTVRVVKD
ncbi:S1C family serine protease [Zavarzinella formosa]|uniref:S1C family serine protease n=1 Tax=Zavarzinella formosa TaxID=360055 RepID=UPI00030F46BC|nr:S1C family serine protease [Zavarzinella formosa]